MKRPRWHVSFAHYLRGDWTILVRGFPTIIIASLVPPLMYTCTYWATNRRTQIQYEARLPERSRHYVVNQLHITPTSRREVKTFGAQQLQRLLGSWHVVNIIAVRDSGSKLRRWSSHIWHVGVVLNLAGCWWHARASRPTCTDWSQGRYIVFQLAQTYLSASINTCLQRQFH